MSDVDSLLGKLESVIARYDQEHQQGWIDHFMARLDIDISYLEVNQAANKLIDVPRPKYSPESLATIARDVAGGKIALDDVETYLKAGGHNPSPPTDDPDLARALKDFHDGFTTEFSSRGIGLRDKLRAKFMAMLKARVILEQSLSHQDAFFVPLRGLAFEIHEGRITREAVLAALTAVEPARRASLGPLPGPAQELIEGRKGRTAGAHLSAFIPVVRPCSTFRPL